MSVCGCTTIYYVEKNVAKACCRTPDSLDKRLQFVSVTLMSNAPSKVDAGSRIAIVGARCHLESQNDLKSTDICYETKCKCN